ncbi:importin-11 [Planococcus citri]|uniref:importin-11 n=1 Tax=Planococcus citri TaxID=170843 RepID=UPI0031F8BF87
MDDALCVNSLTDSLVYLILSQATSQDANILKPAEQKLREWETDKGFYTSLCKVLANHEVDVPVRWLATVCLKNGVDKYWRKTAPNAISEDERSIIKTELMKCFDEPVDAVAFQLAVIMAKIARLDWPKEWPELINILIDNIKCNDNEVRRRRSLLILCHVVKILSTKRLIGDKKLFCDLSAQLFPIMYQFWNFCIDTIVFKNPEQKKEIGFRFDLEMLQLTTKILLKLTVYGFNKPYQCPETINFIASIFERIKTILQLRLALGTTDERCMVLVEKISLTMVKILSSVLEHHPFSYADFVQITFQYCFFYCFTAEGNALVFETILIRWLNLLKAILLCQEYKFPESGDLDERPKELAAKVTIAKMAKSKFFTPVIAHEICYKLINEYFILTEKDLTAWDADPEAYAAEELGECWKYNLKPCTESLFLTFLNQFRDIIIPIVVRIIESNKSSPNPDDMAAILKKDAVYNVFGLSVFELFDEIDFDKWFSEVLIPELHVKSPNYRILRRRIAWLIGRWTGVKLSTELRPLLYTEIINMMDPSEDMAVRLTVANTIKQSIDDFEFRSDVFLEHIPRCFQLLYSLLEQSKECETKMQILNVLSFIIERVGWDIAPFFSSLVNYLPLLWEHSSDHNMLRCAIVSVLTQIVKGLGDQCFTLEKFVILVVECSLDTKQEGHVYLLEDGLSLFNAFLENVNSGDEIFRLLSYLPILIEKSTEHLRVILNIMTAAVLLNPDIFLRDYGPCIAKTLIELIPDTKAEGITLILGFFETLIKIRPYHCVELAQSVLQDSLININTSDDKPTVFSLRFSIMARIILFSNELFAQIIENTCGTHNISRDMLFSSFFDAWLRKMENIWPPERRKLLGLALLNLLTAGSNIILNRFSLIINAAVEVLNDVLIGEDDGVWVDSLLMTESNLSSSNSEEKEYKTEHDLRLNDLTLTDPIHTVDFSWYFQSQLEKLRNQVGDVNFQQLMDTVTQESIQQLKMYIKT